MLRSRNYLSLESTLPEMIPESPYRQVPSSLVEAQPEAPTSLVEAQPGQLPGSVPGPHQTWELKF